jgi:hypothetical protein
LSVHSSEAPQGIDLSRSLFTCTNANHSGTCTCNTRPRVSPHHIVNHSSQPGATIHRSSDAPVLSSPPRGRRFFSFFLCFAGSVLEHRVALLAMLLRRTTRGQAEWSRANETTRRQTCFSCEAPLLLRGGINVVEKTARRRTYFSCEAESPRARVAPTQRWEVLVQGGKSLEGLIGGTPRKDFSCEAETFRKGLSEELLGSPSRVRRKPLKRPSRAR